MRRPSSSRCGSRSAHASCTISVTFTPSTTGSRTGSLSFTDSASTSPQSVSLSGTGIVAATATPASLAFGSQVIGTASAAKPVTLKNNQAIVLNVSSISASGDYSQTNTCGASLAAGASCTVNVVFTPTTTGSRTGTLTVSDDAANNPQTVSLSGTGALPAAETPASLTFGSQVVGVASSARTATLKNNQSIALNISSITTSGDYSQTNNCGTSLAAVSSCTINVVFAPTTTGSLTGTVTVTDDANNSPQTTALSGTGILPATATPASLAFGTQVVGFGSTSKVVTLQNNQAVALSISSITASGDYSQTNNCGASLAPGTSCAVTVVFTPITTGSRTGTLTISDNVSNSPQTTSLSGAGLAQTSISPASLSFAKEAITVTGAAQAVTLTNNEPVALSISSVVASGDFAQTNTCGGSLAAGANCVISVTFSPTATGTRTGMLTITDNANTSPQKVNLTGTGAALPQILTLSPVSGFSGTSVTITGSNFGGSQGTSSVNFNGVSGTPTNWSNTKIVIPVPAGASSGYVVVIENGGASNGVLFNVQPQIATVSPLSASAGTSITISGSNFGSAQGSSTVTFNGTPATPLTWNTGSIIVPVPSAASSGTIVVTVNGLASNGISFTVIPTPNISSIAPASGPIGAPVTISGINFGTAQGSSTITFGGASATPTNWSASSIVVPVPSGATTGNVVVTVNGVSSVGANFTVATLTSLSITPPQYSISLGKSSQLTLMGGYSDGSSQNLSASAIWTSSVPGVATINSTGLASGVAIGVTTVQASVGSLTASAIVGVASFTATGSMITARSGSTQTVLNDGTVLVAGGNDSNLNSLITAEIYNPAAGTFTATGNLIVPRAFHTATLLSNGTVLMTGGNDSNGLPLSSAEIYDPFAGTFSATGSLSTARYYHTATLLNNGKVLIAGGNDQRQSLTSAEIFDPATRTFTLTGSLVTARAFPTATMLNTGKVLVAGGVDSSDNPIASAELYDPVAGTFSAVGSLSVAMWGQTATLLNNGQVLVAGGDDSNGNPLGNAELYNPITATFTPTASLNTPRVYSTATLLNNGTVLVAGGANCCAADPVAAVYSSAELYDPLSKTFIPTSNLIMPRYIDSASLLNNGTVLVVGGTQANDSVTAAAEVYQPSTLTPSGLMSIAINPPNTTVSIGSAQSYAATGTFSDNSSENLISATWSSSSPSIASISNDSSNHGIIAALETGTTVISACAGTICGSATLSVSPTLSSIKITPVNPLVAVGASLQVHAIGLYSDGSTEDLSSVVIWSSSLPSIATINGNGATQGVSSGTTSITAVLGDIYSSTILTVQSTNIAGPTISAVLPSSASIGSTVVISGTGFGTVPGIVTFNGTSASTVWGASQISAIVPPGATSGVVAVQASGMSSNTVQFTVASPPYISANFSPQPNPSGWINSDVMVTFYCANGSLRVVFCPQPQLVNTEGQNQQITGTVTDISGDAATASVSLSIDLSGPTISVASPSDGSSFTSSSAIISGTVADSLSGVASVSCNGIATSVSSGGFSCTVTLNPGINLVKVLATDNVGNQSASLLHLLLAAPYSPASSLAITPANATVVVGGTQIFSASDELGHVRSGGTWVGGVGGDSGNIAPTWTVSNTSIATISSDPQPVLTGISPGVVTLTAAFGNLTQQTQVTVVGGVGTGNLFLPAGTVLWSAPQVAGFTSQKTFRAMPTPNGTPDLYTFDQDSDGNGLVRAFTSDGRQMWKTLIPNNPSAYSAMPDGQGGFVVQSLDGIVDLDGQTGTTSFVTASQNFSSLQLAAVGGDANIYAIGQDNLGYSVAQIDPNSGWPRISARPIPSFTSFDGTSCDSGSFNTYVNFGAVSSVIVGTDNSVVFSYETSSSQGSYAGICVGGDPGGTSYINTSSTGIMVGGYASIGGSGAGGSYQTGNTTTVTVGANGGYSYSSSSSGGSPFSITPDGHGGYLAAINPFNSGGNTTIFDTTSGATYPIPSGASSYWVVGEAGNILSTDGVSVTAFDSISGSGQWSYPYPNGVNTLWPAEGGGAGVLDANSNQGTIDPSGNIGSISACPGAINPLALSTWSSIQNNSFQLTTCGNFETGSSPWQSLNGSTLAQNSSPPLTVATFMAAVPGYSDNNIIWGDEAKARKSILKQLSLKIPLGGKFYSVSISPLATVDAFREENKYDSSQVVGFIGHSHVISNPLPAFSSGLIFTDASLIRTPDCEQEHLSLGLCYDLDIVTPQPVGQPPCASGLLESLGECYPQTQTPAGTDGYYHSPPCALNQDALGSDGLCHYVLPPCQPTSIQVGSFCFNFPLNTQLVPSLTTSAKVVFISSCQTTDVFINWWNINLAPTPGGRALIVPDINAMAQVNSQNGTPPSNQGYIDLVQSALAYQIFMQKLGAHMTAQQAMDAANQYLASQYSPSNYSTSPIGQLPQVVYRLIGNPNVCPAGSCQVMQ